MPAIDAKTSLYCVIGNPVEHSLSPKIHNFLFSKYDINAVYLAFNISENNLKSFFSSLSAERLFFITEIHGLIPA